jgi:hypothetical protein
MVGITTTTTHGCGAVLVSVIDLHLLCGVRITSTTALVLDSIMADLTMVDSIIIGDWFYNKG